jgi:hypothetical protein
MQNNVQLFLAAGTIAMGLFDKSETSVRGNYI